MFYADKQEVVKELGRGAKGACDVCHGQDREVWSFLALVMCLACLTGGEDTAAKGADVGAVQVLKGPET